MTQHPIIEEKKGGFLVLQHQEFADPFDNCPNLKELLGKIQNARDKTHESSKDWNDRRVKLLKEVEQLISFFNQLALVERTLLAKALWYSDHVHDAGMNLLEKQIIDNTTFGAYRILFSELSAQANQFWVRFRKIWEEAYSLEIGVRVAR